jgi:hypothetical protein
MFMNFNEIQHDNPRSGNTGQIELTSPFWSVLHFPESEFHMWNCPAASVVDEAIARGAVFGCILKATTMVTLW